MAFETEAQVAMSPLTTRRVRPVRTHRGSFYQREDVITKLLMGPRIYLIVKGSTELGASIYRSRIRVRSGAAKASIRSHVTKASPELPGRPVGYITATVPYAAKLEWGDAKKIKRGGGYTDYVARRYGRSKRGRAESYGHEASFLLGGNNGKRVARDGMPAVVSILKGMYSNPVD